MESLSAPALSNPSALNSLSASIRYTKVEADFLIIQTTLSAAPDEDTSRAAIDTLPKGLSISAREIVEKLNELLKGRLPEGGIEALKPEDVTPEATADRIVSQIASLFEPFAKQNPDLDPEELISRFISLAREGVDSGYGEAFDILENLGAFKVDGVQQGIEQTKILLEDKLSRLEESLRERFGLEPLVNPDRVREDSKSEVLKQAAGNLKVVA